MTYWWLAALVTFSAAALIGVIASVTTAALSSYVTRRIERRVPAVRARALLRLRLFPVLAAAVGGFGVVLPLFIWFEPRSTHERVAATLIAGGAIAAWLLAGMIWRCARALAATRTLSRTWRVEGARAGKFDTPFPVFVIDRPSPAVAVVGFHRPVLFIAAQLMNECPEDELRAMIAHECAHVDAADNFKRLLLRMCPTLGSIGRALEGAWDRASEEAADASAATRVPALALPLAQALVRVARLTPVVPTVAPVSAFHAGGNVETRVRRLLEPIVQPEAETTLPRLIFCFGVATALVTLIITAPALHQAMESAVAWLP